MLGEALHVIFLVSILIVQDIFQPPQGLPHSLLRLILRELQLLGSVSVGALLSRRCWAERGRALTAVAERGSGPARPKGAGRPPAAASPVGPREMPHTTAAG